MILIMIMIMTIVTVIVLILVTINMTTGVCEKNTPPEKIHIWTIAFRSTKSGAGAVSAAGLHGHGSRERYGLFTDTGSYDCRYLHKHYYCYCYH